MRLSARLTFSAKTEINLNRGVGGNAGAFNTRAVNMKKLNNKKRPSGAGAVVPAPPASKSDQLLAILKHNMLRATEPELVQRLRAAIDAIEARRE
jgi:hypothetical protein